MRLLYFYFTLPLEDRYTFRVARILDFSTSARLVNYSKSILLFEYSEHSVSGYYFYFRSSLLVISSFFEVANRLLLSQA